MSLASLVGFASVMEDFEDLLDTWGGADDTIIVGTNVPYSKHQEFGTQYQQGTAHVRPAIQSMGGDDVDRAAAKASGTDELLWLLGLTLEGEIKRFAPVDTGHLKASYETIRG